MKTLIVLTATLTLAAASARAGLIMYENFSVTPGTDEGAVFQTKQASGNKWVSGYTQTEQPLYYAGDLVYPGLEASSGDAKINLNNVTDIDRGRISRTCERDSGPLYVSFLLRVVSTNGLLPDFNGSDNGNGRILSCRSTDGSNVMGLIDDGAGGFKLAIDTRQNSGSPTYTDSLSVNTTYLVVFGNTDDISVNNSTMSLWINPTPGGAQGAATITDLWRESASMTNALYLGNDSNQANGGTLVSVYMDEVRIGTTWDVVTPAQMSSGTNVIANLTAPATRDVPNPEDLTVVTNLLSGTGELTKTGAGTLRVTGAIAPGTSPGMLTINREDGAVELGIASDTALLKIGDGDLLVVSNFTAPLNLAHLDVRYMGVTAAGTTNWFLYSTTGINGAFNTIDYGPDTGVTIYDSGNNRVGAVVDVPEPLLAAVALLALMPLRRRLG